MNRIIAIAALAAMAAATAGAAHAEGGKHYPPKAKAGHGGVIYAECSIEVFASVNSLDRPSERFVEQIRASIGPRATRAEAYTVGEAYCRHPERLKVRGVAEAALQRDIMDLRKR